MSHMLRYSGIVTKVKAMHNRLLGPSDFEELCSQTSIPTTVSFLKSTNGYAEVFNDVSEVEIHREGIERRLNNSLYRDYISLYKFANLQQRGFLHLRFMHYEIELLKKCVRQICEKRPVVFDFGAYDDFFDRHTDFSFAALTSCNTVEDFTAALSASIYYEPVSRIAATGSQNAYDYETALDLFYFTYIWKYRTKNISSHEADLLTQAWGARIDVLNIYWIYRCKKYFRMSPVNIYQLLIPIEYKLHKDTIKAMAESADMNAFYTILKTTPYGKSIEDFSPASFESLEDDLLKDVYEKQGRKNPYSIAVLNDYLYRKEIEIRNMTPVIEGIRYGLPSEEIRRYVK